MKRIKKELFRKIHGAQIAQLTYIAAKLSLCDLIKQTPKTALQLAQILSLNPTLLSRFLYALEALELIQEKEGYFSPTEEGLLLTEDHEESMKAVVLYKLCPMIWQSMEKLLEGLLTDQSPFVLAHNQEFFDYLKDHPQEQKVFQEAMSYYEHSSSKSVLEGLDFHSYQTVIDIGSGHGNFILSIKNNYPHLEIAAFDLPDVIDQIPQKDSLCTFFSGDFFKQVPSGYDLYLLRNILHDWDDERAVQILKQIQQAMKPSSHLAIFETLTSESQRVGRFADLSMFLLSCGGKERSLEELKQLASQANLKFLSTFHTTGSKSLLLFS